MSELFGIIPPQLIQEMLTAGYIPNGIPDHIKSNQYAPRISDTCYRVSATALPLQGESTSNLAEKTALYKHSLDQPLEVNHVYLIKLVEELALPKGIQASASPVKDFLLINTQIRLLADSCTAYDTLPKAYTGELWIEVIPRSFPLRLHPGDTLTQLRFFHGRNILTNTKQNNQNLPQEIQLDLWENAPLWEARCIPEKILDTAEHEAYLITDFFTPLASTQKILLKPDQFYLLQSLPFSQLPSDIGGEFFASPSLNQDFVTVKQYIEPYQTHIQIPIQTQKNPILIGHNQAIGRIWYEHFLSKPKQIFDQKNEILASTSFPHWFKT